MGKWCVVLKLQELRGKIKNIIYIKDDFSNTDTDTFVTFCGNRYRWVYDCKQERG